MPHLAENSQPLSLEHLPIRTNDELVQAVEHCNDVCMLVLPLHAEAHHIAPLIDNVASKLGPQAVLIMLGDVADLVHAHAAMPATLRYQQWIVLKRSSAQIRDMRSLPHYHCGALIHSRYTQSLRHVKTRIAYSYCPTCDKTSKDYGGKKHTYHHYGTLLSDVWRDCACDLEGDLTPILTRFQDLFGLEPYTKLLVLDCRWMQQSPHHPGLALPAGESGVSRTHHAAAASPPQRDVSSSPPPLPGGGVGGGGICDERSPLVKEPTPVSGPSLAEREGGSDCVNPMHKQIATINHLPTHMIDQLIQGDCLAALRTIPDNSIDFVFTDPPYNVGKKYHGYADDLEIKAYFAWCDQWIAELARVLKLGRTLALLNIPLWSIRHFLFMQTVLHFQNWIVWDALSFPVRLIMPAHYTILAFSKGPSRELPGLIGQAGQTNIPDVSLAFDALKPLAEGYCLRSRCVQQRTIMHIDDRGPLTDLWWDIHRLKHNSRRVDHPTQLPPLLMYRLLAIFTEPGEIVLDCFNGSGTTTLTADQMARHYLGIEKSPDYFSIAHSRHSELAQGIDPFRKAERTLTAKNSVVPRMIKQKYAVSKKMLQLDIKRIAQESGKLPTREDVEQHGKYPLTYYDHYFASWGEVCAAARTTGMSERRNMLHNDPGNAVADSDIQQLDFGIDEGDS